VLDVVLRNLAFRYDRGFALHDVTVTFARNTHTALAGSPACGASTLLRLIAGTLRPSAGDVILGQRRINDVKGANRPLLFVTAELDVPRRWSVQHALVAAVRARSLDREDRYHELELAVTKWELEPLLERRIDALAATEAARVHCARIELLRPAILLADRLLERVSPAARMELADQLYRTLRVTGTTVVSAPSSREELAFTDSLAVLDGGRLVQSGPASEVFARPVNDAAAIAVGEVDVVPVTIRGMLVESVIGSWDVDPPPFQGSGVALVRPADFAPARPGEDSDLIFNVEEAGFANGRWIARGVLTGGVTLRVELPREAAVHKGKLLALRYDPARFRLIPREMASLPPTIPTDVIPLLRDSR
jgi:ABC-type sugar transport system ATPase subunit